MTAIREQIEGVAAQLKQAEGAPSVLVGFDGFVDEILHLVDERMDVDRYRRLETISQFGERVIAAAGYSANFEMVIQQVKLGGNGPIMSDALRALSCDVTYVGAIGQPNIHPVFADFAAGCKRVISLAAPSHTNALEFTDGKLMMGQHASMREIHWDTLMEHIEPDELQVLINETDLLGCVNWTMIPKMNTIFEGLIPYMKNRPGRIKLFVDLADPRKRTRKDIEEVLFLLSRIQEHADIILGINEQESIQVEVVLQGQASNGLESRAANIRKILGLYLVVIHPVRSAHVAWDGGEAFIEGPYAPEPRLTTGAGDVFNAGFCRGLLAGLSPADALVSGVCASGFYVRNARPASYQELVDFMKAWAAVDGGTI